MRTEPVLPAGLAVLASFLPRLEAWDSLSSQPGDHPWSLREDPIPNFCLSHLAQEMGRACYEHGWILNFDWGSWKETEEACRLRDDPEALSLATPNQLARLLTVLFRQERFCDGVLDDAMMSGLLVNIVRRAKALMEETRGAERR